MRLALIGIILATSAIACRQTVEPPTQISVSIQANTSVVTRGDTVTFTVNATGNNLFGVTIDYGDDTTDLYATGGALSARVTFKHAYSAAGSFTVRATVTDAIAGERDVTTLIRVN
jgi:PKD domain-containing protein